MTLAKLMVVLGLDSAGFHAGLLAAQRNLNQFKAGLAGMATGAGISNIGRGLTMTLTLPIVAAAIAIGAAGHQLTSEMARVQSLLENPTGAGSTALIDNWTNGVQQLGIEMGRTSPEVTAGLYEIVSALGPVNNAMQFLEIASRAAVGGQAGIVQTTKNLALATRAWGNTSTDMVQYMADLSAQTVKVGTLTEAELGPALANILPIARLYGVRLEAVFAGLSSLSGVSGTASQASTQLARAITSLVAPNTTLQKLYKQNRIASGEFLIQQLGLAGAFQAVKDMAIAGDVPLQKAVGRIEAVKAIAELTGPQMKAFADQLTLLGDVAGEVDRAFAGSTGGIDSAAFQWAQSFQTMRVLAEDLYIAFAPAARNIANALSPIAGSLKDLGEAVAAMPTDKLTIILGALLGLALLGPVLTIIGGLVQGFAALRVVAVALAGPVGLVVLALAALWLIWQNDWFGVATKIIKAWQWIKDNAKDLAREIEQLRDAIKEIANPPAPEAGEQTPGWFMRYSQALKEFYDVTKATWAAIGDEGANFRARMDATFTNMGAMWSQFSGAVSAVGKAIMGAFLSIGLGAAAMGVGIGLVFTSIVTGVKGLVTNIGQGISTAVGNVMGTIRGMVANIKSAFTGAGWVSIGSSIISGIASGIRNGIGAITNAAATAAKAALNAAKAALGINSPSSVFRNQVGWQISAGAALGIYDGMGLISRAMRSVVTTPGISFGGGYGNLALAGGGGGGVTNYSETNFGDIIVNVNAPGVNGKEIGVSITQALRNRGINA